jgi:hypothetical protein
VRIKPSERTVPLVLIVVNTLRGWKLACPKSEAGLVFPSGGGLVEHHKNIVDRALIPTLVAAGARAYVANAFSRIRRIASGREGISACLRRQLSKASRALGCKRVPMSVPVSGGRFFRDFVLSPLDDAMIS